MNEADAASGATTGVPDEIQALLRGRPDVGSWNQMFALLTVDAHGFPHVCLLSRAQLDADATALYAVVASPHTAANLRRTHLATLVAVTADAAWYCKLRRSAALIETGGLVGATFGLASVKRDAAGVPLRPAQYLASDDLPTQEDWPGSERLLARLRAAAHQLPRTQEQP